MKAKLTFNLEEREERMAHLRCVQSLDMACALFEIYYNSRRRVTEDVDIYQVIEDIFEENSINLGNLIE